MRLQFALIIVFSVLGLVSPGVADEVASVGEASKNSPLATTGPLPDPIDPPTPQQIQKSIQRGVDFLLDKQRLDGGWGSPDQTLGADYDGIAPGAHHGFKLAVAGLVLTALVECEPALEGPRAARLTAAIDRGTQWILAHQARVRRSEPVYLYNIWGHAFGLQGLVRLYQRAAGHEKLQQSLYAAMAMNLLPAQERSHYQDHLAHILLPLQEKDGCWWDYPFYDYHQQYGTAMALYALRQCQRE